MNIEQNTAKHIELLMHRHELMRLKCQAGKGIIYIPKNLKLASAAVNLSAVNLVYLKGIETACTSQEQ
jgi:hypothetical protein